MGPSDVGIVADERLPSRSVIDAVVDIDIGRDGERVLMLKDVTEMPLRLVDIGTDSGRMLMLRDVAEMSLKLVDVGTGSERMLIPRDVTDMSLRLVDNEGASALMPALDNEDRSTDGDMVEKVIDGDGRLTEGELVVSISGIEADVIVALGSVIDTVIDVIRDVGRVIDPSEVPCWAPVEVLPSSVVVVLVRLLLEPVAVVLGVRDPVTTGTDLELVAEYGGRVAAALVATIVLPPDEILTARLAIRTTVFAPLRGDPEVPQPRNKVHVPSS